MIDWFDNPNLLWVAGGVLLVMTIGTFVRVTWFQLTHSESEEKRLQSLSTWWLVAATVLSAALLGRALATVIFTLVSLVALREFARLRSEDPIDLRLGIAAWLLIPAHYLTLWLNAPTATAAMIPVAAVVALSVLLVLRGKTGQFLMQMGVLCFGLLLTTYAFSHALLLWNLSPEQNAVAGGGGWFLFLVLLTESNDIAQALIGRMIGGPRIVPDVSPHKTWAGFLGGVVATSALAAGLAPWLTTLEPLLAVAAGCLISVAGFFGDLNISAAKRDVGVKDSSRLLPGQGGILDRIDSLTFAGPAFYYFLLLVL